ncbi:MAG: hypothetical protein HFH48_10570 [Lachnospiraceae bacterium]|nr:hypothetical protein [Lachnospiraceae bacterium]
MVQFLISIMIMMIPGLLIGGLYAVINPRNRERIFYGKRYLRENQEAWDEYCRNMTHQERRECFGDWVKQRQEETRHEYAWIPNRFHTEPTVYEIIIDGVRRRGTVEEISEHTGIPISLLEQVKYAEYLNTK